MRRSLWIGLGISLCMTTPAFALEKGEMLLHITYGGGQADWVQPSGTSGYITSQPTLPEIRVGGEFWRVVSDHAAISLGAGAGFFSETDKPGTAAPPGSDDQKSTNTSFHVRLGEDMFGNVSEHLVVYGGGGLAYANGKFKYESGTVSEDSPSVTTIALDGRVGLLMKLSPRFSMGGRIGNAFGIASSDDNGAKANWTAKNTYGEGSLIFHFGGN